MAIKGSLKEASLPDVLQLLALGRKTGCLAVADRHNFGYIYFEQGRISYASIVNRRDRLGDMLVKAGRISAEQLEQAIERQHGDRDSRLGEILVEMGALAPTSCDGYIRIQIEEAVYFLFTWSPGTFNFEAGVQPESRRIPGADQSGVAAAGGRPPGGRVEPDREEDPHVRPDLRGRPGAPGAAAAVALSPEQERLLPLLDGSRDVQQMIEDSGLVEFEVGQGALRADHRRLRPPGGYRRPAAARRPPTGGWRSTGISGVAFYKTGMLDEADARIPPGGTSSSRRKRAPPFYLGLIALRQARWEEAVAPVPAGRGAGRRQGRRRCTTSASRWSSWGGSTRPRRRTPKRSPGRGTMRAACSAGASPRSSATTMKSRPGRLARARELLGDRQPPPLWFWAADARRPRAPGRSASARWSTRRPGSRPGPENAVLRNNLAVLLEVTGDVDRCRGACCARRSRRSPRCPRSRRIWATCCTGRAGTTRRWKSYERAAKLAPELGDDLYFKLGNIAYRRRDQERARECWRRATATQSRRISWRGPISTSSVGVVTVTVEDAEFAAPGPQDLRARRASRVDAYKDECLRRRIAVRMRAGERARPTRTICGYSNANPAEYERLADALTINVTRFFRNPETWERLRRDGAAGTLWHRHRRAPDLERWMRVRARSPIRSPCSAARTARQAGHPESAGPAGRSTRPISTACSLGGPRGAWYPEAAFSETPPDLLARLYRRARPAATRSRPAIRRPVSIGRLDLTREDAAACRLRHDHLPQRGDLLRPAHAGAAVRPVRRARCAPGGYLVLGKVETLLGAARERLDTGGCPGADLPADARDRREILVRRGRPGRWAGAERPLITLGLGSCVAIVLLRSGEHGSAGWPTCCCRRRRSAAGPDGPAKLPQTAVPRLLEGDERGAAPIPGGSPRGWWAAPACSPTCRRRVRSRWASATWWRPGRCCTAHGDSAGAARRWAATSAARSGSRWRRAGRGLVGGAWCTAPLSRPTVLVVDDSALVRRVLSRDDGRLGRVSGRGHGPRTDSMRCGRCTSTSRTS